MTGGSLNWKRVGETNACCQNLLMCLLLFSLKWSWFRSWRNCFVVRMSRFLLSLKSLKASTNYLMRRFLHATFWVLLGMWTSALFCLLTMLLLDVVAITMLSEEKRAELRWDKSLQSKPQPSAHHKRWVVGGQETLL